MGMSASQARLLSLQARQSNLEYQGQQINQERTILSQQCTALYNSLLAMQVPTPPSTQDYTTIEYSGTDGATTFTLGAVKPSGDAYNVEIETIQTGDSIDATYGSYTVSSENPTMWVAQTETTVLQGTGNYNTGSGTAPTGDSPYMKKAVNAELKDGDVIRATDTSGATRDTVCVNNKPSTITKSSDGSHPQTIIIHDTKDITYTYNRTENGEYIYTSNQDNQEYILQKNSNGKYDLVQYEWNKGYGEKDWSPEE